MRRLLAASLITFAVVAFAPASGAVGAAPIAAPIRFTPKDGTTLTYGDGNDYAGSLEVRRGSSGLTVINELSLDDYVAGIQEVPPSWPMEALKAQAVAARTYALWELESGHWQRFGYDVCATTDCQVYGGLAATQARNGRRWAQAVHDTSGEVLLYKGKPALTRYHSSDGGRTRDNATVFPSDGPRPYLQAIDDPYDKASPLHTWLARFTFAQMQQIMHDAIGTRGTIRDIEAKLDTNKVKITTTNGHVDMTAVRFSTVVSEFAPKEYPETFPETRSDGQLMPQTLPSSRFDITKTSMGFDVHGIGYGHGVGMSQWGAKGRGDAGQSYKKILAAYYQSLHTTTWQGRNTIRVAIDRGAGIARISGDGPFGVATAGATISAGTVGEWTIAPSGFRSMSVQPPAGYALPLVLTGVRAPGSVRIDPPKSSSVDVGFVLPKTAVVIATLSLDGNEISRGRMVAEPGERTISLYPDRKTIKSGKTYTIELTADDGTNHTSATKRVVLLKPGGHGWITLFAILVLLVAAIFVRRRVVMTRRANRSRSASADRNLQSRTGTTSGYP